MDKKELSFIYTIAHELKTPVITLEGFLNALIKDFSNDLNEEANQYLSYMDISLKRIRAIIDDLLNLCRFCHTDNNKKKVFPIKEVIDNVIIRMKPVIQQKCIKINIYNDLPLVYGNKRQIEVMVENIISNAIKYIGKENPNPRIDIGTKYIDDKKVLFIKDNGIGIEEKYKDTIFDIFKRSPSGRKEAEGTGIGLFIVKNILEEHKGKIWVESCVKKGSTFYIYIPEDKEDGNIKNNNSR